MREHPLLVLRVGPVDAEWASDVLWGAGAQAVEERRDEDSVELWTDLGEDPLRQWSTIAGRLAIPADWNVRTEIVDLAVADSWKAHAGSTLVGDVRIVPAWENTDGRTNDIRIDPGGAFGMGDHPTTRATLELALGVQASNVLDLGCGSGVLAIALAKLRGMRAVAVDIAPAAVEATLANVALNGVAPVVIVEEGDVRAVRGTYDLVLANILAPVLLADAADIAARVAPRGTLILSGFTATRLDDIEQAYAVLGLRRAGVVEVDGWYALQMERVA